MWGKEKKKAANIYALIAPLTEHKRIEVTIGII